MEDSAHRGGELPKIVEQLMRIRVLATVAAVLLAAPAAPLEAQRTGDRARLIFTISGAYVQGKGLWSVANQPVQDDPGFTDNFALSRSIMPTYGAGFSGTYFAGEHVGLTADAFLIGLGYEDNCRLVGSLQSARNAEVCANIDAQERRAAAVTMSGGAVFRFYSREPISPFARVSAGLLFSNQSSVRTEGFSDDGVLLTIYDDESQTRVSPSLALGVGATVPLGRAYHLRWEVRDNIVGIERVSGPTPAPRMEPPHDRIYKHLFSVLIGIDVILERSRGRRY
jgi:opacity protein-like surface antigen